MSSDVSSNSDKTIDGRELSEREHGLAMRRKAALDPLLQTERNTEAQVEAVARVLRCSSRTVWTLLRRYRASRRLVDLAPKRNSRTTGKSLIDPKVEAVIGEVIETYHLSRMRPTIVQTVSEVRRRCANAGLKLPDPGTIRRRIKRVPDVDIAASRESKKVARYRHGPLHGRTPTTIRPLERVQIDHTTVDVIVVDDLHRKPLKRPYITIAIDEYSRAVLGFYLSLDAPSATSVGLCLVHAVLPKDEWAARIGLQFDWPMHGRPDRLYVDNGSDFHSEAVEKGCAAWGMEIEYRPPGMPHFGGVVERMIRTAMAAVKTLPGATGGSIKERGERDPAQDAAMTIGELEHYLATFFAGQYHRRPHAHHGVSPNSKWKNGIFGDGSTGGCGLPPPINDPGRLLIDFLPLARRHISQRGIVWGGIHYMDDILRSYIANEQKEAFLVRRDPRDISSIWFLAPDDQQHYRIRSRDITRPSVSLWELEDARRQMRAEGRRNYDEAALFRAIEAQREIVAAAAKSKSATRRLRLARERAHRNNVPVTESAPPDSVPGVSKTPWHHTEADPKDGNGVFEIED